MGFCVVCILSVLPCDLLKKSKENNYILIEITFTFQVFLPFLFFSYIFIISISYENVYTMLCKTKCYRIWPVTVISLILVYSQVIMPDTEKTSTWRQKKYVVIAISAVVVAAIVVGGFIGGMYLMHKSSGDMVEVGNSPLTVIRKYRLNI